MRGSPLRYGPRDLRSAPVTVPHFFRASSLQLSWLLAPMERGMLGDECPAGVRFSFAGP